MRRTLKGWLWSIPAILIPSLCSADDTIRAVWITCDRPVLDSVVVNIVGQGQERPQVELQSAGGRRAVFRPQDDGPPYRIRIPISQEDAKGGLQYRVRLGTAVTEPAVLRWPAGDAFRAAVVANWHRRVSLKALEADQPHVLLTAGDNVPDLHSLCGIGNKACIEPYVQLVRSYPTLFRQVVFLPVLGNHDKQIRPRGVRPPADPVYDIEATAFRRAFALPDPGWIWAVDIPGFSVRFAALDLHHTRDIATTWQSCHDYDAKSQQYRWYRRITEQAAGRQLVTLYNAQNNAVRNLAGGIWRPLLKRNVLCVAGFGHFAERAEADGVTYLNTSLVGRGNRYPDPKSKFLASEDNYVLITATRSGNRVRLRACIKSLDGRSLDAVDLVPPPPQ